MYFLFLAVVRQRPGKRKNGDQLKAVFSDYFVCGVPTATEQEPSLRVLSLMFCLFEPLDVNGSIKVAFLNVCCSLWI